MARRPGLPAGGTVSLGSVGCGCCPEEARQLACARDDGHVVRLPAAAHPVIDTVQPVLRTVSDLQNMLGRRHQPQTLVLKAGGAEADAESELSPFTERYIKIVVRSCGERGYGFDCDPTIRPAFG